MVGLAFMRACPEVFANISAADRGCAEKTVELHVTTVLRKAGVPSRAALLARIFGSTE